jgi:hypothetical protein
VPRDVAILKVNRTEPTDRVGGPRHTRPVRSDSADPSPPYNPWHDLRDNWPDVTVVIVPMPGRLLGLVQYPVIALRAGTTSAQRRCTLAHEIVHLERGIDDCGAWQNREEKLVHEEVARRLITSHQLIRAVRDLGGTHDLAALAAALDVDRETLRVRLSLVTADELRRMWTPPDELWWVA